jgi:hypothetical protein
VPQMGYNMGMKDRFGNDLLEPAANREPYADRSVWGVYAVAVGSRTAELIKSRMTLYEAAEEAATRQGQQRSDSQVKVYRPANVRQSFKPGPRKPRPRKS